MQPTALGCNIVFTWLFFSTMKLNYDQGLKNWQAIWLYGGG